MPHAPRITFELKPNCSMVSDAYHHYPSLPGVPTRGAFLHDWSSRSQTQKNRSSSHSAFLLYYAIFMYILYRYHTNLKLFAQDEHLQLFILQKFLPSNRFFRRQLDLSCGRRCGAKGKRTFPRVKSKAVPKTCKAQTQNPNAL